MTINPNPVVPAAYISFSAEIDVKTTEGLLNIMAQCANQKVPEVHLLLSTPGGSVMHGINIYNVLRGMPFRLITHNVGNVDSIGNAIFLAADERYACPHSTFMFHGIAYNGGAQTFDAKLARERLDSLKADEARVGTIITDRSSLTQSQVARFFRSAKTLTAQDAQSNGIVHGIQDVVIPPGSTVATLVFNR